MHVFVTGTDTDVGKTLVCTWLCLQTGYDYFKPVQTGSIDGTDSLTIAKFCDVKIHPESFVYKQPLSPHRAAALENETIDADRIILPNTQNMIIEGAGGLMVPINDKILMIDLIRKLEVPVLLVARSGLGTINHTLLSIEAMRMRNIPLLGVIMNGDFIEANRDAIEFYGRTKVLACIPKLDTVSKETLLNVALTEELKKILQ